MLMKYDDKSGGNLLFVQVKENYSPLSFCFMSLLQTEPEIFQSISSTVLVCHLINTAGCWLWSESHIKGRQKSPPNSDSKMSPCLKIQLILFSP